VQAMGNCAAFSETIQEGPLSARVWIDPSGSHVRVKISQACEGGGKRSLLWSEAVEWLRGDASTLRTLLSKVFRHIPYEAFFWECPPVSAATARRRRFEFVALPAPRLGAAKVDPAPFAQHLDAYLGQPIARSFANLGGDSTLVAPAWADARKRDPSAYAHIARFFREAPKAQQTALLQELGEAIFKRFQTVGEQTNIWVSTSGLGVYWLHVRLDLKPKYYQHADYKDPDFGASDEPIQQLVEVSSTMCSPKAWFGASVPWLSSQLLALSSNGPADQDQGFQVESFHVSCQSIKPTRKGNYFGIVLYARGGATKWKCNGVRVRSGYIYITDESCIHQFPCAAGDGHIAAYLRLFGVPKPADVIASGFAILDGDWNFDSSFNTGHAYADDSVTMNEHEQYFVRSAVSHWMQTGNQNWELPSLA